MFTPLPTLPFPLTTYVAKKKSFIPLHLITNPELYPFPPSPTHPSYDKST
ncbi:hypothetical protein COCVIDRAFT_108951 [Bipolaris victoriae FI3]|uniref:Uncharacterized protein n=1 Tax=Bipolaris victoriae (strain FI3) TaxID=930091 RepID=W7EGR0_BIPV3|nr:hypothetical protein COCVIDRAFT_108951 [Bipolaris victoriae FI3]